MLGTLILSAAMAPALASAAMPLSPPQGPWTLVTVAQPDMASGQSAGDRYPRVTITPTATQQECAGVLNAVTELTSYNAKVQCVPPPAAPKQ